MQRCINVWNQYYLIIGTEVDNQADGSFYYYTPSGMWRQTVYSYRYGYSDLTVSGSLPGGVYIEGRLLAGQYHGTVRVTQADGSVSYEERRNGGFTNAMLHEGIAQAAPFTVE